MRCGRLLGAFAVTLIALTAACSGSSDRTTATTTTIPAFTPRPPLPPGLNPIPYGIGDLVALRDLQVRVDRVNGSVKGSPGDTGSRSLTLSVVIGNGALRPQSVPLDAFRLYDLRGQSYVPAAPGPGPIAAGARISAALRYSVPAAATVPVLVVDGRAVPDFRVSSGLISIDPGWRPPKSDS